MAVPLRDLPRGPVTVPFVVVVPFRIRDNGMYVTFENILLTVPTILIYGHDTTLLDTRRWVLERSGYRVETVTDHVAAEEMMAGRPIDLLLLCHTLSVDERRSALAAGAVHRPTMMRLSFASVTQEPKWDTKDGQTVQSFAGAMGLIDAVKKMFTSK